MESPISGKTMRVAIEKRKLNFRKEDFEINYHFYVCEDSGELFESEEFANINTMQAYNQYRAKHKLPFSEEIKAIRNKYSLSAAKMSEILGFGINQYRSYENDEIPSISNARLIQDAADPKNFRTLIERSNALIGNELKKILKIIDNLIEDQKNIFSFNSINTYLFDVKNPDEKTGYRIPNINKVGNMIHFFALKIEPWKTILNKLLFYADFLNYKKYCFSISGMQYRAIDLGPVPNKFDKIFAEAIASDFVKINYIPFTDGNGEKFQAGGNQFDKSLFAQNELLIMEQIAGHFKNKTTKEIIELSHLEDAWILNIDKKDIISYNHGFNLKLMSAV